MFLNSNGTEDDVNEELKGFLRLMNGEEPADEFCREVQESVEKAKMNPEVRRGFMEWEMQRKMEQAVYYDRGVEKGREEGREEGLKTGLEKGREEGMFRTLVSLVQDQLLPLSEAAKRLRMTEDEFRALL